MHDVLRAMARYNRWMNEKLYAIAAELTDDERKRDRGAFFKSIHGTLNHLLLADRIWLARFTGDRSATTHALDEELYADFDELRAARVATDAAIIAWVETTSDRAQHGQLEYDRAGVANAYPHWWATFHFFNHQAHHRGQITTLLTQLGRDPGVTDLVAMLRAEPAPALA